MAESPLPSVEEDFVDPFDRFALKGQSIRPVLPPSRQVRDVSLVQLADEFGLTTAAALEICDEAGIAADDGATMLNAGEARRFREIAGRPEIVPTDVVDPNRFSLVARLEGTSYEARLRRSHR